MGARVLHALGSGVCEALPVQLVNDIFFLHERGTRLGVYTGKKKALENLGNFLYLLDPSLTAPRQYASA